MRLAMVGTGYVGLVTGTCLANTGNHVACLDIDEAKVRRLREGHCPIYEPGLEELMRRTVKAGRLKFSADPLEAYAGAEAIFICVGTPTGTDGGADLSAVLAAAGDIGRAIAGDITATDDGPPIVVIKSTVPVGTHLKVREAIECETSKPFRLASNPEFLKEGQALNDFNKPDRIVLGVEDAETGRRLRNLYEPFVRQGNPIFEMDIPSAQMVKYAANAMLATKISFINEMAGLCETYGADIDAVRRGMCADKRIGNQFLYPGLGYGGSCFPKDVLACIEMGRRNGAEASLLAAVDAVNRRQRERFIAKIDKHYSAEGKGPRAEGDSDPTPSASASPASLGPAPSPLAAKRFAIWGLAFKPGTDDMREAPSLTIIEHLLRGGAAVTAFDPAATGTARAVLGDRITFRDDPMDALDAADALVICTEWLEFRHPDLDEMKKRMRSPVIFDGRNLYRVETMRDEGFVYYSVGRVRG